LVCNYIKFPDVYIKQKYIGVLLHKFPSAYIKQKSIGAPLHVIPRCVHKMKTHRCVYSYYTLDSHFVVCITSVILFYVYPSASIIHTCRCLYYHVYRKVLIFWIFEVICWCHSLFWSIGAFITYKASINLFYLKH